MDIRIMGQAGRIAGHVAWDCLLPDGSRMALTIREIMCFIRRVQQGA